MLREYPLRYRVSCETLILRGVNVSLRYNALHTEAVADSEAPRIASGQSAREVGRDSHPQQGLLFAFRQRWVLGSQGEVPLLEFL
jgi:hypothetical protein